jgi:hypothetical protein
MGRMDAGSKGIGRIRTRREEASNASEDLEIVLQDDLRISILEGTIGDPWLD